MSFGSDSSIAPPSKERFLDDVIQGFEGPLQFPALLDMSKDLRLQYREAFGKKAINMTPSYLYNLPTGKERGTFLTVDIGGSILRLALIRLDGRNAEEGKSSRVLRLKSWAMDGQVKALGSTALFVWVASRIKETLCDKEDPWEKLPTPLAIGLAWSHPIESTSIRTANIFMMAKGFEGCNDLIGREAGSLITDACREQGLEVTIGAIVHDLTGNVLADAYRTDEASISLIYGTGVNAALDIPAHVMAPEKFPPGLNIPSDSSVVMNTELSVYGKDILPITRWDEKLNRDHANPDVQPLEYLIGGRYIGEVVRLILVDAIRSIGLLGGHVPDSLLRPYSLDTKSVADMERDPTSTTIQRILNTNDQVFKLFHLTEEDCTFIGRTCQAVSRRAAAYLATALHALWVLRHECRSPSSSTPSTSLPPNPPSTPSSPAPPRSSAATPEPLSISCHGSVILKYRGLMERCQLYLDELTTRTAGGGGGGGGDGGQQGALTLKAAHDATLVGAALAVACNPP